MGLDLGMRLRDNFEAFNEYQRRGRRVSLSDLIFGWNHAYIIFFIKFWMIFSLGWIYWRIWGTAERRWFKLGVMWKSYEKEEFLIRNFRIQILMIFCSKW